jgi:3-oxoacyl-[acyl-carrier-protein] synthase III
MGNGLHRQFLTVSGQRLAQRGAYSRRMLPRACIVGVASALPPLRRTSQEVEAIVAANSPDTVVPRGIVALATGVRERRVAAEGVFASDLAAEAGREVLRTTGTAPEQVDLLLYASAGQDLMEPATSNIVQEKVGSRAPVMDVKNACNSFLNGLQVAAALIAAGVYATVLVTVGETPSRCIKWHTRDRRDLRLSFPGYTLGDAGAAALVIRADGERGIVHQSFTTVSRFWDVATVPGGGSMHPRGDEFSYIAGDATRLRDAFAELGPRLIWDALEATGTRFDDFSRILVHQVTLSFLDAFVKAVGLPMERIELTLPHLGNMAAATLPVAYAQAEERGAVRPGDRVLWIGLAGGISVGVMVTQH